MIALHSTHLKKIYSDIFETSALQPVNLVASEVIQPVKEIQPSLDVVKSATTTATLYTTPTDKPFYLTNVYLSGAALTDTENTITFVTEDETTQTIKVPLAGFTETAGTGLAAGIVFPLRGVKLKRGSNISLTLNAPGSGLIAGYLGSDREF